MKIFLRQRVRWSRGLLQSIHLHRKMIFNPKYGRTGMITIPYYLLFELIVPVLELLGVIFLILNLLFFDINYPFLFIISVSFYLFFVKINLLAIYFDQIEHKHYSNIKEVMLLICVVFLEPFLYHPINNYASLKGYYNFLFNREKKWGHMPRKGFNQISNKIIKKQNYTVEKY